MYSLQTNCDSGVHPPTLMSVFGVDPVRIGGTEMFARELSQQLGEIGWHSVLCFLSEPTGDVRAFLNLPNVSFAGLPNSTDGYRPARRNLKQLLRKFRPGLLHLHYVSFLSWYPWAARLNSVRTIFFTDHHSRANGHVPQRAPFWKRSAARVICCPVTKVICVSRYGYQCMTTSDLMPRNRFEMIYNGVDLSRVNSGVAAGAAFRKRFSIPDDRQIVTQVSWIIPEKGIADFLEMARLVSDRKNDVHFVLVGEGADRAAYMKQAAQMGLADRLTWTGTIDNPFGAGVFAAADVVCQFSRWEEVFGWMIAEAMAHAKPVVATRVGGIPELIAEGESGYLVERADTDAMANRVLKLLNDSELRTRMGRAGRDKVRTRFDLKRNVSQLIQTYGLRRPMSEPDEIPSRLSSQPEPAPHYLFNNSDGRIKPATAKAGRSELPLWPRPETILMSATLRKVYQPIGIAAALGFLYFSVLAKLGNDWWHDENYSHGLLVPFVIAFILWQERAIFRERVVPVTWIPAVGIGVSLLMLWAGIAGAELFVQRVSLVLTLASITVYFFGVRILRRCTVPLFLLLLAIPIPQIIFNRIAFPLQLFASQCAVSAMSLFSIPVLRQGNIIELMPLGATEPKKLAVVEACSGIRSLMTLATLAVVYAYFTAPQVTQTSACDPSVQSRKTSQTKVYATFALWRSVILVLSAVPIAILTNALRVSGTGVLAHYYGTRIADGFFHTFSGWVMYIVAALLLFASGWLLDRSARLWTSPKECAARTSENSPPIHRWGTSES